MCMSLSYKISDTSFGIRDLYHIWNSDTISVPIFLFLKSLMIQYLSHPSVPPHNLTPSVATPTASPPTTQTPPLVSDSPPASDDQLSSSVPPSYVFSSTHKASIARSTPLPVTSPSSFFYKRRRRRSTSSDFRPLIRMLLSLD